MITLIILISLKVFAQVPISTETLQLRELINNSEQQISALKEILKYSKQDAISLDNASQILNKLSSGINQSIEKYRGTETYEKALLELHKKNNFKNTFADSQELRQNLDISKNANKQTYNDSIKFQKESVRANESDLKQRSELQAALITAQPGLIPKIEAQTQLGIWQTNTRMSLQMTELLASIHAMREELRILRLKENQGNNLNTLVQGAEILNQKQKGILKK